MSLFCCFILVKSWLYVTLFCFFYTGPPTGTEFSTSANSGTPKAVLSSFYKGMFSTVDCSTECNDMLFILKEHCEFVTLFSIAKTFIYFSVRLSRYPKCQLFALQYCHRLWYSRNLLHVGAKELSFTLRILSKYNCV